MPAFLQQPASEPQTDLAEAHAAEPAADARETGGFQRGALANGPFAGLPLFLQRAPVAQTSVVSVQAKLAVGEPDDALEREADRVAAAAVSPQGLSAAAPRCPVCGGAKGCACAASSTGPAVQRALAGGAALGPHLTLPAQMLGRSTGRPLDAATREHMEDRLGHDLGAVRIHDGPGAVEAAEHIQAKAFAYRNDIYFGRDRYRPHTREGQRLLAHELVHTVQQAGGKAPAVQRDPDESWVDRAARLAAEHPEILAEAIAREVYAALDGWDDEPRAIRALSGHDAAMRAAIQGAFHRQHGWSLRGYLMDQLGGSWVVKAYALLRSAHLHDPHTAMAEALIPVGTRDDEIFRLLYATDLAGRRRLEEEYDLTFGERGCGTQKLGSGSLKADLRDDLSGWRKEKALALLDRDLTEADELYFDSVGINGTHEEAVIARLQRVWDRGPAAMMQLETDWNHYVRNSPPWTNETWSTLSLYDAMSSELSFESWRLVRAVLLGNIAYRDRIGVMVGPLSEEQLASAEAIRLEVAEQTLRAASEGAGTNDEQVYRAVRQIREIYTARIERAERSHDERLLAETRAAWDARRRRLVDVDIPEEMDRGTTEYQQARLLTAGNLGPAEEIYIASTTYSVDRAVTAVTRVWAQGRIDEYLAAAARPLTDERGEVIRPAFNPLFVVPVSSGFPHRRISALSRADYDDAGRGSARLHLELQEGTGESELALAYALLTTTGMRAGLRDQVVERYVQVHLPDEPGADAPHRFLAYIERRYGRVHSLFQLQDLLAPARTAAAVVERAQGRYDAAHSGILDRTLTDLTLLYDAISGEDTEALSQESLARLRYIAAHGRATSGELDAMMAIMGVRGADALARVEYGLFQQRLEELRSVRRAITEMVATAVQLAIETVATILTAGAAGPALLASLASTLAAIATREALLGDDYEAMSRENVQQIALVFASHGFAAMGRSLVPLSQEMSRARMFLASAAQEGITQVGTQTVQAAFEGRVPTAEGIALAAMSVIGHGAGAGARGAIAHTPGARSPTGVRADVVHNLGGDVSAARRLRTAVIGHLAQNAIITVTGETAGILRDGDDLSGGDIAARYARAAAGVMARGVLGGLGEFGAHARATARDRRRADEELMHDASAAPAEGSTTPRAATPEPGLVAVARVNAAHTISLVREADGSIVVRVCSPNCGQLLGLLQELRTRADPANHPAIDTLVAELQGIQAQYRQNEPVDPAGAARLAALAGQVDALSAQLGTTQMFQGLALPVVQGHAPWVWGDPNDIAISSVALPPGVGLRGPRDFNGNARDVTDRILGNPPDTAAAFQRVPVIPFDPAIDPQPTGRLYSHSDYGQGASGTPVYLTHLRVDGQARPVAVKVFPQFGTYQQNEVLYGMILGELGVGPRVFGVVDINGRRAVVMEPVVGDFPEVMPVGSRAVRDLETAVQRLAAAGLAFGDFQYFISPDGRAVIIDAGSGLHDSSPGYSGFASGMDREVANRRASWNTP